jgi:hypothetical protein
VSNSSEEPKSAASARPTDVILARARVHYAITCVVGVLVAFIGLGIFALMLVPLAHAIAGKHTDFSFTFSLSVNAALAASTAVTSGALAVQTRRAAHHKRRAEDLQAKLGFVEEGLPVTAGKTDRQVGQEIPGA